MIDSRDVICALGDSLTVGGGGWVAEVFEAVLPFGTKVYNCGVAGDSAEGSLRRIYNDCLCYSPTVATVMFGINDMKHWLPFNHSFIVDNLDLLLSKYKESLEKVVDIFKKFGTRVILFTPIPYFEGTQMNSPNYGCNVRIEKCVKIVKEIARSKNCELIDFYNIVMSLPNKAEIYCNDRVHILPDYGYIFSREVLKLLDVPFNEPIVISDDNKERMKAEAYYKNLMYAEHDILGNYEKSLGIKMTNAQKKERLKEVSESPQEYIAASAKAYLEHFDELYDAKNAVIKKTCEMVIGRKK